MDEFSWALFIEGVKTGSIHPSTLKGIKYKITNDQLNILESIYKESPNRMYKIYLDTIFIKSRGMWNERI